MRRFVFYIFLLSVFTANSQLDPYYFSEGLTPQYQNPASYGSWNKVSASATSRLNFPFDIQYHGTYLGNAEYKLSLENKEEKRFGAIGMGVSYSDERIKADQFFSNAYSQLTVNINYQFIFKKMAISLGVAPGMTRIKQESYFTGAPSFQESQFSFGAGLMIYQDHWYLGFAANHLNNEDFEHLSHDLPIQYSVDGAYHLRLRRRFALMPMATYRYQTGFQYLRGILFAEFGQIGKNIRVGLGGARQELIAAVVGDYKKFRLSYYFILNTSPLTTASTFGHELSLGFRIGDRLTPVFKTIGVPPF